MSEVKIDERQIKTVICKSVHLIKVMDGLIDELNDEKADIFERYKNMQFLASMIQGANFAIAQLHDGFRFGFDAHHPLLQSEKAKERGWNEIKLEGNPFFTSEDEKEDCIITSDDLPDEIKEVLHKLVKNVIKNREKHAH